MGGILDKREYYLSSSCDSYNNCYINSSWGFFSMNNKCNFCQEELRPVLKIGYVTIPLIKKLRVALGE